MKTKTFAVIGGDMRQAYLASLLREAGHSVLVSALESKQLDGCEQVEQPADAVQQADVILLPIPVQAGVYGQLYAPLTDQLYDLQALSYQIPRDRLVFAGAVPQWMHHMANEDGLTLIDYMKREELAVRNAVPTCEGAIQIAMEQTVDTIHGTSCLVIGHGRIGKLLAHRLRALGAQVTISARSAADFAQIFASGFAALDTRSLGTQLAKFRLIFNTVPAPVLDRQAVAALKPPCLLMDLASLPGGIAPDAVAPQGCRIVHELSLPGRVAPMAAARAMYDTVCAVMDERRIQG